jgi:hypothetical protein
MRRLNIRKRVAIAIAIVAMLATGVIWQVRRARAANPPDPDRFGMVGLTRGQTMRLNVVNLGNPPDPDRNGSPPDPCRVVLSFRNAAGQPFTDSNGQVIHRAVDLRAGESAFLDLNGDVFGAPSTNTDTAPVRLQLRPFVRVLGDPPDPDRNACRPTMEVFDNATGRTSLFSAGFSNPPDPDRHQ